MELGLLLVLDLEQEEVLKYLPKETDNQDKAEVLCILLLIPVLSQEVNL